MLESAFNKKTQKIGDHGKFHDVAYSYKIFDDFEELLDTFPKMGILTLNQFFEQQNVFLSEIMPEGLSSQTKYHLDFKAADFRGPFVKGGIGGKLIGVEQQNELLPLFGIYWKADDPDYILIDFLNAKDLTHVVYSIYRKYTQIYIEFNGSETGNLVEYKVKSDGTLDGKVTEGQLSTQSDCKLT